MTTETEPLPPALSDFVAELCRAWGVPAGPLPPPQPFDLTKAIRAQRMESFHRFCPQEFHARIDESKIPNLAAWKKADAWTGKYPGLWLWSRRSGRGKTRMLWRHFGRLHVDHGRTVQRTTGVNLAEEYHDRHKRNQTGAFYRDLCCTDIVMLDDLDKLVLPEEGQGFGQAEEAGRNVRMLRELFDTFYEEHTPVIVTANKPINWFAERIGESGDRRLRAVCTEIEF